MVIIKSIKDIIPEISIIIGAIAAARIAELTEFQTIIITIFLIIVIAFSHLFTYLLNIDRLKDKVLELDESAGRFDLSINKFEESLAKLENHIFRDKGIISFEDVSKLISESEFIYAFNPLIDIETFDDAIKKSIKKKCVRRFIVSSGEAGHFETYIKGIEKEFKEEGLNIECGKLFSIAAWPGSDRPLIPITVVISKSGKAVRVWLHPSPSIKTSSPETYKAFYIDDPGLIRYFQTWFRGLWKKLKNETIEPL